MTSASRPKNSPRIAYRLSWWTLATAAGAMLFAVVLLVGFEYWNQRDAMFEDSRAEAAITADNASAAVLFADTKACQETLHGLHSSPTVQAAAIFGTNGEVLAQIRNAADDFTPPPLSQLLRTKHPFTSSSLEVLQPILHDNELIGYLYLKKSLQTLHSRMVLYAAAAFTITLGAIFLAALLILRIRRTVIGAEERLHTLAHIDAVTGLFNRHAFQERLAFAIEHANRFGNMIAVLLIDLDNFKNVNDTLGHLAGDELLRQIAGTLRQILRRDDVVSRQGGDEFAVLLQLADAETEPALVADKIVSLFTEPFMVEGVELVITGSVGVALYPRDADSDESLLRHADTAMYEAKAAGKNAWRMFAPTMNAQLGKRLALTNSLRQALEKDELLLHYQPLFDLALGRIVGAEALLRWNSPEHGMVPPMEFIPIAEDCGMIVTIGDWVIRTACRAAQEWNQRLAADAPIYVAANLSAKQLRDESLSQRIFQALKDSHLPPDHLELELTESVIMENVHSQIETLHKLKQHGIRLAVDDFGTGYSSMAYLRRLPITKLKIDRAFISDLPRHENDCAIVSAVVALGHSLGLTVVAEGVEKIEQAEFLLARDCDVIQGYLVGRPLPFAEFLSLLGNKQGIARELAALRSPAVAP